MGKLRSGILGNIRGKVAGVVGGQWKDVNYLREYVKPANPNTTAQQEQRSKMARAVAFVKPIVGTVLNVFMDPFQKSMSGFNRFIKSNIQYFIPTGTLSLVKITEGKLYPAEIDTVTGVSSGKDFSIDFDDSLGSNGSDGDNISALCYNHTTGQWTQNINGTVRSAGTITLTDVNPTAGDKLNFFVFAASYSGAKLVAVSDSSNKSFTAL